ncbi:hypothetical protein EVAR_31585_1 [Eumeta japonica]|uniref:Uncharacterized protein n=1 Tax=Eumeta variegata TaxID=151549 RepID=A0A4C1VAT3_EUMVA|nr:hypothetical protein EVAR_31585_1 [Eumeta japonica]
MDVRKACAGVDINALEHGGLPRWPRAPGGRAPESENLNFDDPPNSRLGAGCEGPCAYISRVAYARSMVNLTQYHTKSHEYSLNCSSDILQLRPRYTRSERAEISAAPLRAPPPVAANARLTIHSLRLCDCRLSFWRCSSNLQVNVCLPLQIVRCNHLVKYEPFAAFASLCSSPDMWCASVSIFSN